MTADTLTREDVQLHTGTDPEKHAHIVLKRDALPGEPVEALCGYVLRPKQDPRNLPVCQACKAVFDDNEARSLAAGWRGPKDV